MRSLSAGQLGQFAVVLALCLLAAACVLRVMSKRRRPRVQRPPVLRDRTAIHITPRDREQLRREAQEMVDALRRRVEREAPVAGGTR